MKIETQFQWGNYYDWLIIPTIMLGFRRNEYSDKRGCFLTGFGVAILFLKFKFEIICYERNKSNL